MFAQNYKEDIKKMYDLYNTMDKYYAEISVKTYENTGAKQPNFTKTSIIRKDGNKYHYTFDNMVMLVNNKYSILANKDQKNIVFKTIKKAKKAKINELAGMSNMDEIIGSYKSVKFNGIKNGSKHYTIYPKHTFEKAELYIKPNGLVTKIIYKYKNAENTGVKRMVATFKNSTLTPVFSKTQFSEKQFFAKKGDKYTPIGKYKNYDLIKVNDHEK
jgi:hypothetical protein